MRSRHPNFEHGASGAAPSQILALCLAFCCWHIASAQPVILQLRGGDRISGTITSENAKTLVLSNQWVGSLTVPVAEIIKRESAGPAPAAAKSPLLNAGALTNAAPRPGTAIVAGPLQPPKPKLPKHWTGEAQVGVDLVFSERQRQLYSGRFKVGYVYEHFKNVFDYTFAYGKTDGLLSHNRMFGSSKSDFELGKRLYVYNFFRAGLDDIRKIDLRYELGPGLGCHLLKQTNLVLNTEWGVNYQAQELSDHTKSELFFYRLAENSAWTLNGRFSVDEKFEFFPRVDDWVNYRFRFESNLRYALLSNLAFVVTAVDQYDTQPAQKVSRNDLQVRSSISLKF